MLEILIIRHGETAWNTADIFRGRVPIGLSEDGYKQAEKLAEYLRQKKITAVFCSPLKRAIETAELVAQQFQSPASMGCRKRRLFSFDEDTQPVFQPVCNHLHSTRWEPGHERYLRCSKLFPHGE